MTRTEKELLKVLVDLGIAEHDWKIRIRRTYSGRHQLAMGAWKWWADKFWNNSTNPWMELCGSVDSCTRIIKAHKSDKNCIVIYRHIGGLELVIERK